MLTTETVTVETVTAELEALDGEQKQRREALDIQHKAACQGLREEISTRRKTYRRLLAVLQAEAGKQE